MRVDAWLRDAGIRLGARLWPPRCVLCAGSGQFPDHDLCEHCEAELPRIGRSCSICAEPLSADDAICGACVRKRPRFERCVAPYRYAYPLDHMIRALKYGNAIAYGRVLGNLFARHAVLSPVPDVIVPVPLGHARFVARGYNQALELAAPVASRLGIRLRADVLVRTRETREQAGLERRERRKNLRNAFAVAKPLEAAHVAVFDDVVTTGSTANEIARVLRRAGATRVELWAIARAARAQ
jgi:ComF family protein